MKTLTLLGLLVLPVLGFSQVADSVAIRQVDSLIQISRTLTGQNDFDKALEVIATAEALALEKLGRESVMYGSCCFNHGRTLWLKGDYPDSEKWYLESKAIREKTLGREHPDFASSLSNLANLYRDMGQYEKAETLHLEAKAIREKALGKEDPDFAVSLNNLALLYEYMGQYEKAVPLHLEAKGIWGKQSGKEDTDYAMSLNNLAIVYTYMGQYEKAEPLFLEAKAIYEKTLGKEDPDYAMSLMNLAGQYWYMGQYEKAEPLLLEAIAIDNETLGKDHPSYAMDLNNLAALYWIIGQYEKAEPIYLEAKATREEFLGKGHPDYAISLNNMAALYLDMGQNEKAETLLFEAKAIYEKILGTDHPNYAGSLSNLANLYQAKGQYEKAEPLSLETKAIQEKVLGKGHPDYATNLNSLANLYNNMGQYEKAAPLFLELSSANKHLIERALYHLSERELSDYLKKFSQSQDQTFSFTQIAEINNLIPACYDNSLFYKGFLLQSTGRIKQLALSDEGTAEKYIRLQGYQRRLNVQYAQPIAERDSALVAQLETQANDIEKDLIRTVAGWGEATRQVKWNEVRDVLKPGEAAVEFVHYQYYSKKPTDSTMYAALVLLPGAEAPQFIPLFEEREITPQLKGASGKAYSKINALYSGAGGRSLHDLIWKPLESVLNSPSGVGGGVKTVYCSPSGLLHKLNLGAISNEPNRQVVVLGSTRRLVLPDQSARTGTDALLIGGVHFNSNTTAIAAANAGIAARDWSTNLCFHTDTTATRGDNWNYLPESVAEVLDIQNVLLSAKWTSQLDTGYFATEEAFRSIGGSFQDDKSPRILHLATHGFFYPDPKKAPANLKGFGDNAPVFKLSEHPMIRSGLILAGAQEAWETGKAPENREDGILTAYEISQMNLSNTELVVLSACETGLGYIEGNEGVYGLQRAFKIAGAKYLIMSLWKVNDKTSGELMTDFYRQWLEKGLSIPEAFRAAQSIMKKKYSDAPYHWAGFVLVE